MAEVITRIRSKIKLRDLSIEGGLYLRDPKTRGFLLEIPCQDSAPKADRLAARQTGDKSVQITRSVNHRNADMIVTITTITMIIIPTGYVTYLLVNILPCLVSNS